MFVYLQIGIWRGPNENKQYSTPVQYVEQAQNVPTKHTNTSDVSIRYPFVLKSPNFIYKDQRNTFTNKYVCNPRTALQSQKLILRKQNKYASLVGVMLKDKYFKTYSHQRKLKNPTSNTEEIFRVAKELIKELYRNVQ